MYLAEGIIDIYTKTLHQREEVISNMPPGDVKAQRRAIADRVRGLLAGVDHMVSKGLNPSERAIDEIELWLSKL